MFENFFEGKGLDEIVIHPCCHEFLMGFSVQIDIGEQQDIGSGVGVLYLFDDLESGRPLNDVLGYDGGKMLTANLIDGLLLAPCRMDVVSPFLEKRL